MNIPSSVFEKLMSATDLTLKAASPFPEAANLTHDSLMGHSVERAMRRILDATPAERFAMMELAIPLLQEQSTELPLTSIDVALHNRLIEFVTEKALNIDVLMTGALLLESNTAKLPETLPVPHSCQPGRR